MKTWARRCGISLLGLSLLALTSCEEDNGPGGERAAKRLRREPEIRHMEEVSDLLRREIEQLHRDKFQLQGELEVLRRENEALRAAAAGRVLKRQDLPRGDDRQAPRRSRRGENERTPEGLWRPEFRTL